MTEEIKSKTFEELLQIEIAAQDPGYPYAIFKMKRSRLIQGTRNSVEEPACFVVNFVKHGYMDMGSITRFERTGKSLVYLHIPESFQPKDEENQKNLREIIDHMQRYQALRAEMAREFAEKAMSAERAPNVVDLPTGGIKEKIASRNKERNAQHEEV
jgi:hypothetical protein